MQCLQTYSIVFQKAISWEVFRPGWPSCGRPRLCPWVCARARISRTSIHAASLQPFVQQLHTDGGPAGPTGDPCGIHRGEATILSR